MTDFGQRDSYVGIMKGVILRICPDAHIIDITHEIPPQDVTAAAYMLQTFTPYFPRGTIHVVVVDPGVGSQRQAIALETPQARYVGPDNGVFAPIWQAAHSTSAPHELHAVALTEPRFWLPQVSATFHGRDIFAPVAAHLACGVALAELGTAVSTLATLPIAEPAWESERRLVGQVITIDHFGNGISNITTAHLARFGADTDLVVTVELPATDIHTTPQQWEGERQATVLTTHHLTIRHTYADVAPGEPLALIGSTGQLEVAVRNGNAAQTLGIVAGSSVLVQPR
jgi:hypothetical protein